MKNWKKEAQFGNPGTEDSRETQRSHLKIVNSGDQDGNYSDQFKTYYDSLVSSKSTGRSANSQYTTYDKEKIQEYITPRKIRNLKKYPPDFECEKTLANTLYQKLAQSSDNVELTGGDSGDNEILRSRKSDFKESFRNTRPNIDIELATKQDKSTKQGSIDDYGSDTSLSKRGSDKKLKPKARYSMSKSRLSLFKNFADRFNRLDFFGRVREEDLAEMNKCKHFKLIENLNSDFG